MPLLYALALWIKSLTLEGGTDPLGFVYKDAASASLLVKASSLPACFTPPAWILEEDNVEHTASPPGPALASALAELTDAHNRTQRAQHAAWDDFIRKMSVDEYGELDFSARGAWAPADLVALSRLVRLGIPVTLRPNIWLELSGSSMARNPGEYPDLVEQGRLCPPSDAAEIEKDVLRTFVGRCPRFPFGLSTAESVYSRPTFALLGGEARYPGYDESFGPFPRDIRLGTVRA